MSLCFWLERWEVNSSNTAIIWHDHVVTYGELLTLITEQMTMLDVNDVPIGSVVLLEADYSPATLAVFFALMQKNHIIVPMVYRNDAKREQFCTIAEVSVIIKIDNNGQSTFEHTDNIVTHSLLQSLKASGEPGLILFSSGATGDPKAIVHNLNLYIQRFSEQRHQMRTLNFLLFDHIAGLNTLFYTLASVGCSVFINDRTPSKILQTIEQYRVELLPTSPTFLNLMLLSGSYQQYDLSSLKLVTYGSEVMPKSTLERFREAFPQVKIFQQYGLSEMGVARSKSKSPDSLYVKFDGDEFKTRVRDGLLEVKSHSAMLGYLNEPSPFTEDGWFKTGDAVTVDGDYIHILGRESEVINIGGEKVFPVEVESVLLTMDGVQDVMVVGKPSPLIGNMVCAYVQLTNKIETVGAFRKRVRLYCKDRLDPYKVPQKVVLVDEDTYSERFKKLRRSE